MFPVLGLRAMLGMPGVLADYNDEYEWKKIFPLSNFFRQIVSHTGCNLFDPTPHSLLSEHLIASLYFGKYRLFPPTDDRATYSRGGLERLTDGVGRLVI